MFYSKRVLFVFISFISFLNLTIKISKGSNAWIDVRKKSENAVIQIFTNVAPFDYNKPHIEPVFTEFSRGSGFFINDEGYILTNFHVIGSGQVSVLRMQHPALGKDLFDLEIVGCHVDKDFAVLRVERDSLKRLKDSLKKVLGNSNIPYLKLGNSDSLEVGSNLMVMGYPLGYENLKISTGNMSGCQNIDGQYLIQTEAAVNSGNSGGPFLDEFGNVVGIVVGHFPEAQSIGFFIPISNIYKMVEGFLSGSYNTKLLKNPFWGGSFSFSSLDTLEYLSCPCGSGVYVRYVFSGSLFERCGVKEGDIIYSVNGSLIDKYGYVDVEWSQNKVVLSDFLDRLDIGDEVNLVVYRDKAPLRLSFIVDLEDGLAIKAKYPQFKKPKYFCVAGMVVMDLSVNHLTELKNVITSTAYEYGKLSLPNILKYDKPDNRRDSKVVIVHIIPGSIVDELRCFQVYDILDEVNGIKVKSLKDFENIVADIQNSGDKYLCLKAADGSFSAIPINKIQS